eukprot:gnl/MRDRNA2_/MRDRNA2_104265_c0_seq1.p1 gnl/MRDRNA2_/MRDRNA2_104265_c0~~gnl/MRDRNA2_/MRDRNA2_104265_c0_seq1.p1  ORF type:complete len:545 (-),score=126.79 gnl/MRDRNA2_/MRDRNA2_104265_c0_seq1:48-1682(-)
MNQVVIRGSVNLADRHINRFETQTAKALSGSALRPADPLQKAVSTSIPQPFASNTWRVDNFEVAAAVGTNGRACQVFVAATAQNPLVLNYGFAGTSGGDWHDVKAVAMEKGNSFQSVIVDIAEDVGIVNTFFVFVLGAKGSKVFKDGQKNFELALPQPKSGKWNRSQIQDVKDVVWNQTQKSAPKVREASKPRVPAVKASNAAAQEMALAAQEREHDLKEAAYPQAEQARRAAEEEKCRAHQQAEALRKSLNASMAAAFASQIWQVDNFQVLGASRSDGNVCRLKLATTAEVPLILHYGFADERRVWNNGHEIAFKKIDGLQSAEVVIAGEEVVHDFFMFVLKTAENKWFKNGDQDFELALPKEPAWAHMRAVKCKEAAATLAEHHVREQEEESKETQTINGALGPYISKPFGSCTWHIDNIHIAGVSGSDGKTCKVKIVSDAAAPLVLHYGFSDTSRKWTDATEVAFSRVNGWQIAEMSFAGEKVVHDFFMFVVRTSDHKWIKNGDKDFELGLPQEPAWAQARAKKAAAACTYLLLAMNDLSQ